MIRFHEAEGHVKQQFCSEKCKYETNVPSEYERNLKTDRHDIDGENPPKQQIEQNT